MNFDHKIVQLPFLQSIQTNKKKRLVLAGGCFDILHYGHIQFIRQARTAGDALVLLLESDDFIERIKKKKPVHTQQQRAEILASIGYVDFVVKIPILKNPDREYKQIVADIGPYIIALSEGDRMADKKQTLAQSVGAGIITIPYLSSFSSSQLITYAPIFRD